MSRPIKLQVSIRRYAFLERMPSGLIGSAVSLSPLPLFAREQSASSSSSDMSLGCASTSGSNNKDQNFSNLNGLIHDWDPLFGSTFATKQTSSTQATPFTPPLISTADQARDPLALRLSEIHSMSLDTIRREKKERTERRRTTAMFF